MRHCVFFQNSSRGPVLFWFDTPDLLYPDIKTFIHFKLQDFTHHTEIIQQRPHHKIPQSQPEDSKTFLSCKERRKLKDCGHFTCKGVRDVVFDFDVDKNSWKNKGLVFLTSQADVTITWERHLVKTQLELIYNIIKNII